MLQGTAAGPAARRRDAPRSDGPGRSRVVPGGSANVFARALGMPRDPVEATAQLLRALAAGQQPASSGSAGPTTGGSRSTRGWAGTPTSSPRSSAMRFRGLGGHPAAVRRHRAAAVLPAMARSASR